MGTHNLCLSKNKKNNVYPCKPHFYYIKVGFKGSKLYRCVFVMYFFYFTISFEFCIPIYIRTYFTGRLTSLVQQCSTSFKMKTKIKLWMKINKRSRFLSSNNLQKIKIFWSLAFECKIQKSPQPLYNTVARIQNKYLIN